MKLRPSPDRPIFKQVAEASAPLGIWFHMVDADTHRDIGNAYGVNGYPVRAPPMRVLWRRPELR